MRVTIGEHTLPIGHKNMMGSLTEVWKIGNAYRTQRGLPELDLSNWLRSPETLEYVKVVEHDLNFKSVASTDLSTKGTTLAKTEGVCLMSSFVEELNYFFTGNN